MNLFRPFLLLQLPTTVAMVPVTPPERTRVRSGRRSPTKTASTNRSHRASGFPCTVTPVSFAHDGPQYGTYAATANSNDETRVRINVLSVHIPARGHTLAATWQSNDDNHFTKGVLSVDGGPGAENGGLNP